MLQDNRLRYAMLGFVSMGYVRGHHWIDFRMSEQVLKAAVLLKPRSAVRTAFLSCMLRR